MEKNDLTNQTYIQKFDVYKHNTPDKVSGEFQVWMDDFISLLPENAKILEIGSAVGRDARYFKSKGFQVLCADVIPEALQKLSDEGFETSIFDFRDDFPKDWQGMFDGFFANAVLLHAPPGVFEITVSNIVKVLKPKGIAAFSLKVGEGEELTEDKVGAPRYFNYHTKEEVEKLLKDLPFEIIKLEHVDQDKWLHVIVQAE